MGFDPITLGVVGLSALASGASGVAAHKAEKKSLKAQQQAQQESLADATRQARLSAEASAKLKKPNVSTLLTDAQEAGSRGIGSTMLTGPSGVDPATLPTRKPKLGGATTLLGG